MSGTMNIATTKNATAYITMPPCKRCFAALVKAGIKKIVTRHSCPKMIQNVASRKDVGVELVSLSSLDKDTYQNGNKDGDEDGNGNGNRDESFMKKQQARVQAIVDDYNNNMQPGLAYLLWTKIHIRMEIKMEMKMEMEMAIEMERCTRQVQ
eukprot:CAMPEP_0203743274 /NCGR_PEP_ID=MMETSP0092-20131115/59360_1 /ASSEMBLY_ACC=CAM_ASM_001090 /TAXON_ID=426623 /ORGANISM="Chaetoceros affinis, Strain CCMP159" /LENGTH=151 /DNA_ID=CAMNT_0050630569 /DNA_START=9 /DNA_END=464 /DNA_ORIENTATION=-